MHIINMQRCPSEELTNLFKFARKQVKIYFLFDKIIINLYTNLSDCIYIVLQAYFEYFAQCICYIPVPPMRNPDNSRQHTCY